LKAEPDDGRSWAMLGRSLRLVGQVEPAKAAFKKAITLMPDAVEPRVEYAGLLIEEAQGAPSPEAVALLREVLTLDPDQMDALFFVAQAELADGHTETARTLLGRLAGILPPGSTDRAEIEQQLERLK
jgi:cytochrome c-type biogenesis protein CcmH